MIKKIEEGHYSQAQLGSLILNKINEIIDAFNKEQYLYEIEKREAGLDKRISLVDVVQDSAVRLFINYIDNAENEEKREILEKKLLEYVLHNYMSRYEKN